MLERGRYGCPDSNWGLFAPAPAEDARPLGFNRPASHWNADFGPFALFGWVFGRTEARGEDALLATVGQIVGMSQDQIRVGLRLVARYTHL